MPSLKKIAADLGVSHALVSMVLNNRMGTTRVSEKTRNAILEHAKKLDYRPNVLARALKRGRKGVVGVFLHSVGVEGSDLSVRFIEEVGRSLSKNGLNLWLQFFESDEDFLLACNERLLGKVDGLIIAGMEHPDLMRTLAELQVKGLHVASARLDYNPESGVTNFIVDQRTQAYLAARHLLEIGCRRIAHFHISARHFSGYQRAHEESGVIPDKTLAIRAEGYRAADGRECMRKLLATNAAFDAVCAQSDAQAVGALQHLSGLNIPRGLWPRITGVDDSPIASQYSPIALTSVTAEMQTCARLAVEAICLKLDGKKPASQLVTPQLVVRESTVP